MELEGMPQKGGESVGNPDVELGGMSKVGGKLSETPHTELEVMP